MSCCVVPYVLRCVFFSCALHSSNRPVPRILSSNSPRFAGDNFRRWCRQFPSLVNCCTIDWFDPWPPTALRSVAARLLADVDLATTRRSLPSTPIPEILTRRSISSPAGRSLSVSTPAGRSPSIAGLEPREAPAAGHRLSVSVAASGRSGSVTSLTPNSRSASVVGDASLQRSQSRNEARSGSRAHTPRAQRGMSISFVAPDAAAPEDPFATLRDTLGRMCVDIHTMVKDKALQVPGWAWAAGVKVSLWVNCQATRRTRPAVDATSRHRGHTSKWTGGTSQRVSDAEAVRAQGPQEGLGLCLFFTFTQPWQAPP